FYLACTHLYLHSFPTRRSSDLHVKDRVPSDAKAPAGLPPFPTVKSRGPKQLLYGPRNGVRGWRCLRQPGTAKQALQRFKRSIWLDRKSTRLNSSHLVISYAVFC